MSSLWYPSKQYQKVAKANLLAYAKNAERYDRMETCVVYYRCQLMLERDIDEILYMLHSSIGKDIYALDACGGSGNVALKLLDKGVKVVLCDISPELIEIFESKYRDRGFSAESICQEIGYFLSTTDKTFDLIVFSSALHHIEDYIGVLQLASARLTPGGMIYTVFDGVKRGFLARLVPRADYIVFKVLHHPSDIFPAFIKRFKKMKSKLSSSTSKEISNLTEESIGMLAEYHALRGIDDFVLVDKMHKQGLAIIWHKRYPDVRCALFRFFLRFLRISTSFKLLMACKR